MLHTLRLLCCIGLLGTACFMGAAAALTVASTVAHPLQPDTIIAS